MTHQKTKIARSLRHSPNMAERVLWNALKNRQLGGHKFTRQMPIGPYYVDFVCRSHDLVIEVDGSQHQDQQAYDRQRDEYMLRCGYSVFRVPTSTVLKDLAAVCDSLIAVLDDRMEDETEAPELRLVASRHDNLRRGRTSRSAARMLKGPTPVPSPLNG